LDLTRNAEILQSFSELIAAAADDCVDVLAAAADGLVCDAKGRIGPA